MKTPWHTTDDNSENVNSVMQSMCNRHILFGIKLKLTAYRQDCDDFLYELCDGTGRYAVIHPTWKFESDPTWPSSEIYQSLNEFMTMRHDPDNEDWEL